MSFTSWLARFSLYTGKTTLAALVVSRLNAFQDVLSNHFPRHPLAAFVPMDGYHLTRAQLDAMPDPSEAHRRRGAEFTFDGPSFLSLVKGVRAQKPTSPPIYAPSFDHAKKDPIFDDLPILGTTRIVVFEGLYLSLDKGPWREAGELMDEMWFVDVDVEIARVRLVERHVKSGIAADEKAADERARGSDLVNGEEIIRDRVPSDKLDEIVISKEDETWQAGHQVP